MIGILGSIAHPCASTLVDESDDTAEREARLNLIALGLAISKGSIYASVTYALRLHWL